jgi:hypothetical protein
MKFSVLEMILRLRKSREKILGVRKTGNKYGDSSKPYTQITIECIKSTQSLLCFLDLAAGESSCPPKL